jgi:hypothetical protein
MIMTKIAIPFIPLVATSSGFERCHVDAGAGKAKEYQ